MPGVPTSWRVKWHAWKLRKHGRLEENRGKNAGMGNLGWGPLNNQPHIDIKKSGYLLVISLSLGSLGVKQLGIARNSQWVTRWASLYLWSWEPGRAPNKLPLKSMGFTIGLFHTYKSISGGISGPYLCHFWAHLVAKFFSFFQVTFWSPKWRSLKPRKRLRIKPPSLGYFGRICLIR